MNNKIIKQFFLILFSFLVTFAVVYAEGNGEEKAFDKNGMDTTVNPSNDFYDYAVGKWIKENPVPDEYSRWGSFEVLTENNYKILKEIFRRCRRKQKC